LFDAIVGVILIILPFIAFAYIYVRYGKEETLPEINTLPKYIKDISEINDISPSEAAIVLNPALTVSVGDVNQINNIIGAEIMELVRKAIWNLSRKK
jgi:hypothetical protein